MALVAVLRGYSMKDGAASVVGNNGITAGKPVTFCLLLFRSEISIMNKTTERETSRQQASLNGSTFIKRIKPTNLPGGYYDQPGRWELSV